MFCKHQWKVLDKTRIPAPIEKFQNDLEGKVKIPRWMFDVVISTICTCEKCGKIKRFVTKTNYGE